MRFFLGVPVGMGSRRLLAQNAPRLHNEVDLMFLDTNRTSVTWSPSAASTVHQLHSQRTSRHEASPACELKYAWPVEAGRSSSRTSPHRVVIHKAAHSSERGHHDPRELASPCCWSVATLR